MHYLGLSTRDHNLGNFAVDLEVLGIYRIDVSACRNIVETSSTFSHPHTPETRAPEYCENMKCNIILGDIYEVGCSIAMALGASSKHENDFRWDKCHLNGRNLNDWIEPL